MSNQRLNALCMIVVLAACDSTGPSESVGSVDVIAPYTDLELGHSVQLEARLINQAGVAMTGAVTWNSSQAAIATVSSGGMVTATGPGQVRVTASSGGRSGFVDLIVRAAPCTGPTGGTIVLGESRAGTLSITDCTMIHGGPGQGWRLNLTEQTRVRIDLSSSAFDALIMLTDLTLQPLAWDDDNGGGTNARLVATLPPGSYIAWALALDDGVGAFQLTTQIMEPYSCANTPGSIGVGQTRSGTLGAGDCVFDTGHYADAWTLTLASAATVSIDLTSSSFDTFLILSDANGNDIATDDDGGGGYNSRLALTLAAGQYTLWASSFAPGETGPYQLSVAATAGGPMSGIVLDPDPSARLRSLRRDKRGT
ncbi:MAG: Ig-like domain-containing protein [Gemmatimonadetes bacterium]|nr:Ig-like domain-containing protein [Gemmatimonadota bacterium]